VIKAAWGILTAGLVVAGCGGEEAARAPARAITIFAAASLRDVMTEISAEWTRRGGEPPRLRFEASSVLARQIREGAPADLFVSASPEWVTEVQPLSRADWMGNRLVLVVRRDAPDADLENLESLAMAAPQVPAGRYARAAFAHLGIEIPRRTIYGSNVRDVLATVSEGGAGAGIVYATDAAIDPEVRISFTFPPASHPPIVYSIGLLTEEGRGFFNAMQEPWAVEIARRHGFTERR
jgi:molybdate transport system substrate-binding protein